MRSRCLLLALSLFLLGPILNAPSALAACTFSTSGYYTASYDSTAKYYGGYGSSDELFGDGKTTSGSWIVRSITVWKDQNNWAEFGWFRYPEFKAGNMELFQAESQAGTYDEWDENVIRPMAAHAYTLASDTSNNWTAYFDYHQKHIMGNLFRYGWLTTQMERHNTCDDGQADWWNLHRRYSNNTYALWSNVWLWADSDATYNCVGASHSELWSYASPQFCPVTP